MPEDKKRAEALEKQLADIRKELEIFVLRAEAEVLTIRHVYTVSKRLLQK